MSEMLEMLLKPEAAHTLKNLPEEKYRIKRLSEACGEDVVFTLRGLPYGRMEELRETGDKEMDLQLLLAGVADPDLKDRKLSEAFGGVTPAETVKNMLLPGEVEAMDRVVARLSGYQSDTIEAVKNA